MSWLTVLSGIISLIGRAADYLADRQLIGAGEATAISRGLRKTLDEIELARRARDAVANPQTAADRDYSERVRDRFKRPDE